MVEEWSLYFLHLSVASILNSHHYQSNQSPISTLQYVYSTYTLSPFCCIFSGMSTMTFWLWQTGVRNCPSINSVENR